MSRCLLFDQFVAYSNTYQNLSTAIKLFKNPTGVAKHESIIEMLLIDATLSRTSFDAIALKISNRKTLIFYNHQG